MSSAPATTIDSIKRSLVGLHMPRALEVLDATLRRIEQGEIDGIGALEVLTVVDTFSRFSPVVDPRFSYRAEECGCNT